MTAHTAATQDGFGRMLTRFALTIGVLFVIGGVIAWVAVSGQLAAEKITVSGDAPVFAGATVQDPLTAFVQAGIINEHALAATGGKTYAELGSDDPARETVMTASFLRASLFTSVVSFGVALFAAGVGCALILLSWAQLRRVRA